MLPRSEVKELHLNNNKITDAGAIKLAERLPSSSLTDLRLDSNQITDAGAIKLAEMLPNSKHSNSINNSTMSCNRQSHQKQSCSTTSSSMTAPFVLVCLPHFFFPDQ